MCTVESIKRDVLAQWSTLHSKLYGAREVIQKTVNSNDFSDSIYIISALKKRKRKCRP
jgi:hypothetical protein